MTKKPKAEKGVRLIEGKLKLDLPSSFALEGLAKHMQKSLVKYDAHNWAKGLDINEVLTSLERHILALKRGELTGIDSEDLEYATVDAIHFNTMVLSHFFHTGLWEALDSNMEYNTVVGNFELEEEEEEED